MVNPTGFENIFDLAIKTGIGIAVSVAAYHVKRVGDDIDTVKRNISEHTAEISVLQANSETLEQRLGRIETKLDQVIFEVRKR